ncbi:MobF family relaxase [Micrococcus luteus]|uniref:Conjugal transfer protein n=4 Tax=Bacteria TaxID=2 RepID=A0AAX0VHR5_MICLU|nr:MULTISPECIES: MobF family relaxase [Micrococcus]OFT21753.1 conjugal transfer protein [Micrococcus sp. HMSC30C05]MCK1800829.1 relaxase domain-containing protein [Micrococcus sp. XM4230B]MCK1812400.1 relaxase domain-containing protein [Micrococcus sp. XM4230A]MCT1940130.1 relaxase domain-containing protein [Micrococcus luteus]MCV7452574.1 relaxase domain-containing protein [Micrococcus luteus]
MTVSMRVMSAGDGYKYLLRTVAAGDGDRSLSTPLTRYYNAEGTPPGRWLGAGVAMLGSGRISAGDQVSEAQLQLLVGMGRDPITGEPLGRAYPEYRTVAERIEARSGALDPSLGLASRAEALAAIEAGEAERGTRRAVAGFDFTFSIPKSASVLWAVADAGTQTLIADAHHAAVAEVVAFMEREVAATRAGASGRDGAVAQVDVAGLIATAFDHYDSRAGDPHLHTHVVISNKVQTVLDGKWRSLDGRPMHAAVVALSELHEAVFADHLTRMLGVSWEARDRGRDRNPAWVVTGVPEALVKEFSTRARHIDAETDRLIERYVETHGRRPSPATIMKLRAQATLTTRPEKEVQSLAALTASWRERAGRVLASDATSWARGVTANEEPLLLRADDVPLDMIDSLGADVVATVGEKRSTWHRWNLTAEAARQTMAYRFASTEDREAVVGMVVDAAEAASLRLTPPELASSPAEFRRSDGTSVFRPKHSALFSSEALLAAEDRLLERARTTTAPTVPLTTVERITKRPDSKGRMLGDDQAAALTKIALSGRMVDVLVGPAGAGKTTAMSALRRAWEREHGRGSVVGLAPSAVAAQVLADDLSIQTENTAKWLDTHDRTGETFRKRQLVIVDEASLAGTLSLDRITTLAAEAGAKVLLVGDHAQLQSVTAGGAFSFLVRDRDDAPELVDVHRFVNVWEKTASLALRYGRTDVIDTYAEHGRVIGGESEEMIDAAYTAWRTDTLDGRASVLVTDSNESVQALNNRARADLILDGTVNARREVELHDGTRAAAGDTVITRRNDRRLRAGRSWVRNGDRWTVTEVRDDGALTLHRAGRTWGASVVVPAEYAAEHLDLGYAVTSYRAQGITVDSSHVLADASMTRETFYVAMTRGREENIAYVAVDKPDPAHDGPHPGDNEDASARSVLFGVLQHVGAELSAHETITAEQDTWGSIAQLAAEYETLAAAAQHDRWAALIRSSGLSDDDAEDAIASPAFGALTAELRRAEANQHDVETLLPRLVGARGFGDADDIAAVLHYRVAKATGRPAGSGRARKAPRLIAGLIPEATGTMPSEMWQALAERRDLIETRTNVLLDTALTEKHEWIMKLGVQPKQARTARAWRNAARTIAAYRDRYGVTGLAPLGARAETETQKLDAARARAALDRAQNLAQPEQPEQERARRTGPQRVRPSL